jgi:hypothetical protein
LAPVSVISSPFEIVWPSAEGGNVLLTAALLLLGAWLLGVAGAYDAGTLVHVLLLVGLMLLLLAALKGRDAEAADRPGSPSDHR